MKKLRELQGGYPRQQDYLLKLQNELFAITDGLLGKLNRDMVLQGCAVTDNGNGTVNIAAGIIYVGGEALRYDGGSNILSDGTKTFIKQAAVTTDPKVFGDGNTKDVYSEVKLTIGTKTSVTEIAIKTTLYTLESYIKDVVASYAIKGEYKDVSDLDGTFLTNFDGSGLGITARFSGWALANGNNGTPNLQGRTRVASGNITDPGTGEVITFTHGSFVGEVNHKLTGLELPKIKIQVKLPIGNRSADSPGNVQHLSKDNLGSNGTKTYNSEDIGNDVAHNNMQPSIIVYTIIKIV